MASPVRTPDEIEALKRNWLSDPCWDIEHTDGFEAHYEELHAYRVQQEAKWEQRREEQRQAAAAKYKCSVEAAAAIEMLLSRVRDLEALIANLEARS